MKIICVGKNYAEHVKEMGGGTSKDLIVFMKPDTALIPKNHPFVIPHFSNNIHHEIEVVVKISRIGKHIEKKYAHKYYKDIALGIDFTARDKQNELKKEGLPWEMAKAFDFSAFVSSFTNKSTLELKDLSFHLDKNNITVQKSSTKYMLQSIDDLVSKISEYFTLKMGDLIFTGTPEGVGKVEEGDVLVGYLENEKMFDLRVI